MRVSSVSRSLVAAAIATVTACSIWAALDNPYKSDALRPNDGDASIDGMAEGGVRDATPGRRLIEAGFIPYAIDVHGDTVYVVDDQARVHVAYEASTNFTDFWAGDGGDTFLLQTNGIAATAAGVFWTVNAGIRYCSVDGGGCDFLPSGNPPRAVAASDPVVAWIDKTGVRTCARGLTGCVPASVAGSLGAASVAVGPTGTIAWTDGGKTIRLADGLGSGAVDLPYDVALVATDDESRNLYWAGQAALGFVQFDGGGSTIFTLTSQTKPIALFARRGSAYWSLRGDNGIVVYCRFDSNNACSPKELANGLTPAPTTNDGIVATSHEVLAIVSSDLTSALFVWPGPL
jgi:hypothetical protein